MFRRHNERETAGEMSLLRWGFALRGEPHIAYGIWDHEDGRTIHLYDDGHWFLFGPYASLTATGIDREGRGDASLINYLRGE